MQGAKILVHANIAAEFLERFTARIRGLRLGDPFDIETQVGPLISATQRDKVAAAVDRAIKQGAHVAVGGQVPEGQTRGWFYEPTVLTGVSRAMDIWNEEIFGPVTVLDTFHNDAEAVAKANDSSFGLAGSIWSQDTNRALRMVDRLDIGIVWINDHHRIDPSSPWGGTKNSGIGTENGYDAYLGYSRPQSTIVNISDQKFDWYATTADLRYS